MQAAKLPFADRHPIATLILRFVEMMVVYVLAGAITSILKLDPTAQILIGDGILVATSLLIVARHGWWQEAGLGPVRGARPWFLIWLPVLAALAHLLDGIHVTALSRVGLYLVCALLVGFVEEIYFRGIFMRLLQPYGQNAMILWSAILFGVTHSLNVLAGQDPLVTVLQIAYAFAVGFLFAVLRVKIGSIWPLVAAHALIDFLVWITQGGVHTETSVTLAVLIIPALTTVGFFVNGIWLLRSRPQQ